MTDHDAAHWRRALEANPDDLVAVDAFSALCRAEQDWSMLATLLEHRLERTPDPLEQRPLLSELLAVYRDELADSERAAAVAKRLVDLL
jgi:hypothetical protein